MPHRADRDVPGAVVHLAFTGASDGDLSVVGGVAPAVLATRRARVAPGPWTWLRQVHGPDVVVVDAPGASAGAPADAAVTDRPGAVLAVHTADCAGVLLWDAGGARAGAGAVVGAAHAGWRGLAAGVLQATVVAMRRLGATDVRWALGPCISPGAYEFGEEDLAALVGRYGPALRALTADGRPALDLRAGVRAALEEAGATADGQVGPVACTATQPGWFSWRARADTARQAAVVWSEAGHR